MSHPTILITNDDGLDTAFLRHLAAALAEIGRVYTVAPATEQSWTGKAMSRHREVAVRPVEGHAGPAWAVEGTPADCVNIAVGHLLPRRPDLVVAGINIGFNAGLPLILSSGTVAAALEGALLGLPALALSQHLPPGTFKSLKSKPGALDGEMQKSLAAAAAFATRLARTLAGRGNPRNVVHNVNFPFPVHPETPCKKTVPARFNLGSLYRRSSHNRFHFRLNLPEEGPREGLSDMDCLRKGWISHGLLDFGALGSPGFLHETD